MGLTTSAVQTIDDQSGAVTRNIGTGWGGELLEDWTSTNSNWRLFGTNGHHDVTWTAGSAGAVTGTVRYDPWGTTTMVRSVVGPSHPLSVSPGATHDRRGRRVLSG